MFFNEWLDILLYKKKPEQIVAEKPQLGQALASYTIALLVVLIINAIAVLAISPSALAIVSAAGILIGGLIFGIIGVIVVAIIFHVFALIVGGKGDFNITISSIIKLEAAYTGTIGVLTALIGLIVAVVPALKMISVAWSGVVLIAGLYLLVLMVLLVKAAHNLSIGRAVIAVIVIPLVILLILALLAIGTIIALLSSYSQQGVPSGLFSLLG